ncbi:hypothetical protein GCM10010406_17000 [Streptomyces thermolineatus]|uniref:Cellulose synthase n=1 Tax=Streptomyces thermolineatus TaxID=44033 RepID=A0ABN3LEZ0_9ACTN
MLTSTVCVALSAAGLVVALLTAWRRRFSAAARIAAVALLPVGLYLTGLVTVAGRIVSALGRWAADLVLDPGVWAGFAVLAASALLYAAGRVGRRRTVRRTAGERGAGAVTAAPGASAQALGRGTSPAAESAPKPGRKAPKDDDPLAGFEEIEEILRRRGI